MIPIRGALWMLGAVLTAFLLFWGYGVYERSLTAKDVAWKSALKAKDDSLQSARTEQAKADSAYNAEVPIYVAGRDRILHDTVHPPTPAVKACYESADKLISACEVRHRADSVLIAQLGGKVTLLENKPSEASPRIQAYGEALYDVTHMSPVARIGATARLLGPVSLSVAGDLAMPSAGLAHVTARGLVGVRVNF